MHWAEVANELLQWATIGFIALMTRKGFREIGQLIYELAVLVKITTGINVIDDDEDEEKNEANSNSHTH